MPVFFHCILIIFLPQTLSFMVQLLDYSRIVGEVLQGQSSFAVTSSDDQRNIVLGKFLSKRTLCSRDDFTLILIYVCRYTCTYMYMYMYMYLPAPILWNVCIIIQKFLLDNNSYRNILWNKLFSLIH